MTNPIDELLKEADWARRLARRLVRDAAAADDVVQQAWLAALRTPPRVASRSWLGRVVRNLVRDDSRGRGAAAPGAEPTAKTSEPRDALERLEQNEELGRAVADLPAKYRDVLVLRYFDDLPPREIARRLGIEGSTVRSRLERGLRHLRGRLDARFGDRRAWVLAFIRWAEAPERGASAIALGAAVTVILAALGIAMLWPDATVSPLVTIGGGDSLPVVSAPPGTVPRPIRTRRYTSPQGTLTVSAFDRTGGGSYPVPDARVFVDGTPRGRIRPRGGGRGFAADYLRMPCAGGDHVVGIDRILDPPVDRRRRQFRVTLSERSPRKAARRVIKVGRTRRGPQWFCFTTASRPGSEVAFELPCIHGPHRVYRTVEPPEIALSVAAGRHVVHALDDDNERIGTVSVDVPERGVVHARLERRAVGTTMTGRILRDGRPAADACVRVHCLSPQDSVSPAFSDDDGKFTLVGLRAAPHQLLVQHADQARGVATFRMRVQGLTSEARDLGDLHLYAPATNVLRLRVVGDRGPVADHPIRVTRFASQGVPFEALGWTDGKGRVAFCGVGAGELEVTSDDRPPDHEPLRSLRIVPDTELERRRESVAASGPWLRWDGGPGELTVAFSPLVRTTEVSLLMDLGPARRLPWMRCLTAPAHEWFEGASLSIILRPRPHRFAVACFGKDAVSHVALIDLDTRTGRASHPTWVTQGRRAERILFTLRPEPEAAATVLGRVFRNGTPVANATVTPLYPDLLSRAFLPDAKTDADGHFRLGVLPRPGLVLEVPIQRSGRWKRQRVPVREALTSGRTTQIEVLLPNH